MRSKDISKETKGVLELLIHELQEAVDLTIIEEILQSWIEANNLHPENVQTLIKEINNDWAVRNGCLYSWIHLGLDC